MPVYSSDLPANGQTPAIISPTVNNSYFSSLETNGDNDWFVITVTAGYTYSFGLRSDITSAAPLQNGRMEMFSDPNSIIASTYASSNYITITAATSGKIFLNVYDSSTVNGTAEGDYRIDTLVGDDVVANATTNRTITSSGITSGALAQSNDSDYYRVQFVAGRTYDFMLTGDSSASPLDDGEMQLINSGGTVISTVYKDKHLSYTPTTSGTYYLNVFDSYRFDAAPEGNYRITSEIDDTIQNNASTHRWVTAGTISEKLEQSNDSDWFKVNFKAGLTYGFKLTGDGSANTLDDGRVNVINAGNQILASAETDGTAGYTATTSGIYYIEVKDNYSYDGLAEGNYRLTSYLSDTILGNSATTSTLAANGSFSSRIDAPKDIDWIKVTLKEGLSYGYKITPNGGSNGVANPDLFLFAPDAVTVLAGQRNYSDTSYAISATATTSGTYFLQAGQTQESNIGNYTVTSIATDTVRSDARTTERMLDGERVTGRIDVIGDADWYGVKVTKGREYTITLSGDGGANQLINKYIGIYDSNGTLKPYAYDSSYGASEAATYVYTADKSGMIYLGAKDGTYLGPETGNFRLQITSDAFAFNGDKGANDMTANAGNNLMHGNGGKDVLRGQSGNDKIHGDGGKDDLYGNNGNDSLFGGAGNDHLDGGKGDDLLKGNAGKDVFHFARGSDRDRVLDFQDNKDSLHFSGLGVKTVKQALSQAEQLGSDVVFDFGKGDVLIVENTTLAALSNDIIFG